MKKIGNLFSISLFLGVVIGLVVLTLSLFNPGQKTVPALQKGSPEPSVVTSTVTSTSTVILTPTMTPTLLPETPVPPTSTVALIPTMTPTLLAETPLTPTLPTENQGSGYKVVDIVRFDGVEGHICHPYFAPEGDQFLCSALADGVPQLWLASLTTGLQQVLLNDLAVNFAWTDNQHLIYSLQPQKPDELYAPQPVFMMDLNSGQSVPLGQSTLGSLLQLSTSTSDIAFIDGATLQVVKVDPTLSVSPETSLALPLNAPPPQPSAAAVEGKEPPYEEYYLSYGDTRFAVSPDGQKAVLFRIEAYRQMALTLLDLKTGQEQLLAREEERGGVVRPFSWASDGIRLVYSVVAPDTRLPQLWVLDTAKNETRLLLSAAEAGEYDYLTWLPGQEDIYFAHIPGRGTNPFEETVYQVISSAGGQPQALFSNGRAFYVSAGGRRVTFVREIVEGTFDPSGWIATLAK